MSHNVGRVVPCAPPGVKKPHFVQSSKGDATRPARRRAWPPWLSLTAVVLAGCQSVLVSTYVSPRVTGRVLAADTHLPLAGVSVKRVNPTANQDYGQPAKGGQRMDAVSGARTDQQGRFVLEAERDLTLVQQQVWVSETVAFQKGGYVTLRTNFTLSNIASNAPDGAPVINAGNIRLRPVSP